MDVMTSGSVMSVDGEEIPGRLSKETMLVTLPESRKSENGQKMTW